MSTSDVELMEMSVRAPFSTHSRRRRASARRHRRQPLLNPRSHGSGRPLARAGRATSTPRPGRRAPTRRLSFGDHASGLQGVQQPAESRTRYGCFQRLMGFRSARTPTRRTPRQLPSGKVRPTHPRTVPRGPRRSDRSCIGVGCCRAGRSGSYVMTLRVATTTSVVLVRELRSGPSCSLKCRRSRMRNTRL